MIVPTIVLVPFPLNLAKSIIVLKSGWRIHRPNASLRELIVLPLALLLSSSFYQHRSSMFDMIIWFQLLKSIDVKGFG